MESFFFWLLLLDFLSVLVIVKPHSTAFMGSLLSDEEKDTRNGEHGDHPILPRGQLQFFHFGGMWMLKTPPPACGKQLAQTGFLLLNLAT